MTAKRLPEVAWIKVKNGTVHLDWEELGDVLGLPYDFTVNGNVLELQLLHADAIVSGHMPKSVFIRNVTARLRALPHVVSAPMRKCTKIADFYAPGGGSRKKAGTRVGKTPDACCLLI